MKNPVYFLDGSRLVNNKMELNV